MIHFFDIIYFIETENILFPFLIKASLKMNNELRLKERKQEINWKIFDIFFLPQLTHI
jgi:hypothetical protein